MNFSTQLSNLADSRVSNLKTTVSRVIKNVGEDLVSRSPVGEPTLWGSKPPKGYVGGQFKGNWQHGFGSMNSGNTDTIDPSGRASIDRINKSVDTLDEVFGRHYLYNNLPYAQRLEDGWSNQAPSGMVGLTILDFPMLTRDASSGATA